MSDPINGGDLVMVTRGMPCCGSSGSMGFVFRVDSVVNEGRFCANCHRDISHLPRVLVEGQKGRGFTISRLIKINPPSLESDTVTDREMESA